MRTLAGDPQIIRSYFSELKKSGCHTLVREDNADSCLYFFTHYIYFDFCFSVLSTLFLGKGKIFLTCLALIYIRIARSSFTLIFSD